MRSSFKALLLVLALAAPAMGSASGKVLQFDDIRTQQAEIREGVTAHSGRYKNLSQSTRTELLVRQAEVLALIKGKQIPDDLSQEQRTEVFNHLEWIEAAINDSQDERLICEQRKTIGSNRRQRVCRTAAQIREDHDRARQELDRADPQMRR